MKKILLALPIVFLVGCSSFVNGSKETVNITSNPAGARVYADGAQIGQTPIVHVYNRGKTPVIQIRKSGYVEERFIIQDSMTAGSYLGGNFLLTICTFGFGIVGFVVDPITGAMWEAEQKFYNVELTPAPDPSNIAK